MLTMSKFVDIAVAAAKAAEKVLSHYFLKNTSAKRLGVEFKAAADIAADKAIYNTIHKAFPNHSLLTEERANKAKFSEYTWVIDPIDGTTNFISGFPLWATSIGLIQSGMPILTVINIPQLNRLYVAAKGQGAKCNQHVVKVDQIANLQRSNITLDMGYHPQRRKLYAQMIETIGEHVGNVSIINSVCVSFPFISSGNLQGLIHNFVKLWELPTCQLLLEEAGGKVTNFQGKKISLDFNPQSGYEVVASNGKIHRQILSLL